MTKSFRHVGVLMMVAIVALGALGAAYTLWYEDLELHADVTTGTFDVDWSCEPDGFDHSLDAADNPVRPHIPSVDCPDAAMPVASTNLGAGPFLSAEELAAEFFGPDPSDSEIGIFVDKLPTCTADIGTSVPNAPGGPANDAADDNVFVIHAFDLYPFSGCEVWLDIHNDGTVPAHFAYGTHTSEGDAGRWLRVGVKQGPDQSSAEFLTCQRFFGESQGVVLSAPNGTPLQLHAGDELICHLFIWLDETILLDNGDELVAPENSSGTIWWTWKSYQWNEDPT